jgi:hypothetical protein
MASQNQQDTLPVPHAPAGHIVPAGPDSSLTRGQKRVIDEYQTQLAAIDAQAAKTVEAERVYSELHIYTHDVGVQTISHIEATQAQMQSQTVHAFCERQKQLYSYQALGILSSAGEALHREVSRSVYPVEPRRRKLFGG